MNVYVSDDNFFSQTQSMQRGMILLMVDNAFTLKNANKRVIVYAKDHRQLLQRPSITNTFWHEPVTTGAVISLTGLLFDLTMTAIENLLLQTHLNHYCTKSYFNVSVSKHSNLYRTVRNIANIDRPSFIAELSSVSEFSSVENANQFCDFLRTVLDKHAPPSLRKVITHSSSMV